MKKSAPQPSVAKDEAPVVVEVGSVENQDAPSSTEKVAKNKVGAKEKKKTAPAPVKQDDQLEKVQTKDVAKAKGKAKVASKKPKLVRDSFTFPATDYALIGELKQRALKAGHEIKKSEILRAGLLALSALSESTLIETLGLIDKLKPGRPSK